MFCMGKHGTVTILFLHFITIWTGWFNNWILFFFTCHVWTDNNYASAAGPRTASHVLDLRICELQLHSCSILWWDLDIHHPSLELWFCGEGSWVFRQQKCLDTIQSTSQSRWSRCERCIPCYPSSAQLKQKTSAFFCCNTIQILKLKWQVLFCNMSNLTFHSI